MLHSKDWDEGLPFILFGLCNAHQESLRYSPAELLFGRELRSPLIKTEKRELKPADSVLILSPIKEFLKAKYEGSYTVLKKVNDNYAISTPGKRSSSNACILKEIVSCSTTVHSTQYKSILHKLSVSLNTVCDRYTFVLKVHSTFALHKLPWFDNYSTSSVCQPVSRE